MSDSAPWSGSTSRPAHSVSRIIECFRSVQAVHGAEALGLDQRIEVLGLGQLVRIWLGDLLLEPLVEGLSESSPNGVLPQALARRPLLLR